MSVEFSRFPKEIIKTIYSACEFPEQKILSKVNCLFHSYISTLQVKKEPLKFIQGHENIFDSNKNKLCSVETFCIPYEIKNIETLEFYNDKVFYFNNGNLHLEYLDLKNFEKITIDETVELFLNYNSNLITYDNFSINVWNLKNFQLLNKTNIPDITCLEIYDKNIIGGTSTGNILIWDFNFQLLKQYNINQKIIKIAPYSRITIECSTRMVSRQIQMNYIILIDDSDQTHSKFKLNHYEIKDEQPIFKHQINLSNIKFDYYVDSEGHIYTQEDKNVKYRVNSADFVGKAIDTSNLANLGRDYLSIYRFNEGIDEFEKITSKTRQIFKFIRKNNEKADVKKVLFFEDKFLVYYDAKDLKGIKIYSFQNS